MLGFTVAGCSDFTSVVDLRNGTEMLDGGCHGKAVEAFTKVIEPDAPEQPLEMAYWRRSPAPYESGRLEEAVSDDSALMDLAQDNPDFLPADAQLLAEAHAFRTTAHLTSGDFDNAETDLRTVIVIPPEDHEWSQGEVACRAQTGEIELHASQQSSSAYSVDIRCIGSHVARHSVLSLLPGPRAASASGAKAGRGDER
jgi:tetratricopeptide (TPR) repeat protein